MEPNPQGVLYSCWSWWIPLVHDWTRQGYQRDSPTKLRTCKFCHLDVNRHLTLSLITLVASEVTLLTIEKAEEKENVVPSVVGSSSVNSSVISFVSLGSFVLNPTLLIAEEKKEEASSVVLVLASSATGCSVPSEESGLTSADLEKELKKDEAEASLAVLVVLVQAELKIEPI